MSPRAAGLQGPVGERDGAAERMRDPALVERPVQGDQPLGKRHAARGSRGKCSAGSCRVGSASASASTSTSLAATRARSAALGVITGAARPWIASRTPGGPEQPLERLDGRRLAPALVGGHRRLRGAGAARQPGSRKPSAESNIAERGSNIHNGQYI